jgi:Listeria-Bacteroides repeat domain (List_Bact_rpt)
MVSGNFAKFFIFSRNHRNIYFILIISILLSFMLPIDRSVATSSLGSISSSEAFAVYMDAPNVQGSYIAREFPNSTWTDTYDTFTSTNVACPSSGNIGTYSFASGWCKVFTSAQNNNNYVFGGALTTTETATTTGTQTPSVWVGNSAGTTITLNQSVNYLGLWWSAGSTGNSIKFYQDSALVLTLSVDDICNSVKASGTTCGRPSDNSSLTAIDGTTTYLKRNYFGHPLDQSNWDSSEPFTYMHVFAQNRVTFNKINISTTGNGFEYDNLTVGNLSQADVKSRLVAVRSYGTTHYLKYDTRGGQSIDSQTVVEGGNVSVTNTIPTRTGFSFNNWNTAANGSGTSYSAGNTYPSSGTITTDTTLYAQWTLNAASCSAGSQSAQTDTATGATVVVFRAAAGANGTCTFIVPAGVVAIDYLVVAGGGGGGSGGGGAGGLVTNREVRDETGTSVIRSRKSALAVSVGSTINVTIGIGGRGGGGGEIAWSGAPSITSDTITPTAGSDSSFGSVVASGGGRGGYGRGWGSDGLGGRGGSGGGAGFDAGSTSNATTNQSTIAGANTLGNAGGAATGYGYVAGAGGGGSGAVGNNVTSSCGTNCGAGADGGDGVKVDIFNTGTFTEEFACGGGGGINANDDIDHSTGGGRGGCSSAGTGSGYGAYPGNGAYGVTNNDNSTLSGSRGSCASGSKIHYCYTGTQALAGYGGGGGGTDPDSVGAGSGGSGIVVISFLINNASCPNDGINSSSTRPLACNFTVSIRAGRDTVTVDPRGNPYSYSDTPTTTARLIIGVDSITITVSNNSFTISAPGTNNPLRGGTYPALYSLTTTGTDTSSAFININVTDPAQHTPTRVGINPWVTSMKVPAIVFGTIDAVLICVTPRSSTSSGYGNIPTVTMSSVASNALRTNLANGGIKLEGTVDSITANASNFRIVKNSSDTRLLPGTAERVFDVNVSNTATGGNGSCNGGSESTLTVYRLGFSQKNSKNLPLKNGNQP